ncbi:DUF397 domain-containing protein [Streptomyces monashensis]|uniref:DUF397 domain-containing protein n=1 Tax=Streptomyces monashensis TaxID=1678012 RepID=UPI0009A0CB81
MGEGDLLGLDWHRSSACDPYECVEVAVTGGGVRVRESHRPDTHGVAFAGPAWRAFLGALCGRTRMAPTESTVPTAPKELR